MPRRGGAMHVTTTRRHYKDRVYETHLLRRSYREGDRVRNETLANLSHLPGDVIEVIRRSLRGESFVAAGADFDIARSRPHGHVAAVWAMARQLGFPGLLGPPGPERDLAMALVVSRVVRPGSKLATTRWWADTTLAPDLGLEDATMDDVYGALDWLYQRQGTIEKALAKRHLQPGGLCLYDLSSSYMEGSHCPLARRGYSRDGKKGKAQIEYGLLCDPEGRPISIEVFAGNTADPAAFVSAVGTLRNRFGLSEVVVVGDRGMVTSARIDALKALGGMGWVTSLRAPAIQALAADGALQLSLFDEANLAEITHPCYPGERLVLCRNLALAEERARKREDLLHATEALLDKVVAHAGKARLKSAAQIGVRVGRDVNRHKMAKHFELSIQDGAFGYTRKASAIQQEAALDGVYVIRTSVGTDKMSAPEVVEAYKSLAHIERAFRSMKTVDLELRPVHHRLEERVRAHALVCMLAEYLVWHLRRAWAPLTFTDEDRPARSDPVAPARRSRAAATKASRQHTPNSDVVHSFHTLLDHLATLSRDDIVFEGTEVTLQKISTPTPTQRRAFELLDAPVPLKLM